MGVLFQRVKLWAGGFCPLGAGKSICTTLKVLSVIISLTATVSVTMIALDATKISPLDVDVTKFISTSGPSAWLNASFSVTMTYDGSVFSMKDVNLTLAVYGNAEGVGDPMFADSRVFTLSPHSSTTLNYEFSRINPPSFTALSAKATLRVAMSFAEISFIGFDLGILCPIQTS